jgi:hypothetical protein
MRDVRLGNALGGHLRQMGLKLGDPKAYGLAIDDKDVYVDRSVEIAGKKLTYTRRYSFDRPFYIPTPDDQNKLNKGRVPNKAKLFQESLEIFEKENDKQLFYYKIFGHQDKSSFHLREECKVRTEEAEPKEAVREAMKIFNDQSSQNQKNNS